MCEWTPELDRAADQVADAIVAVAASRHPVDSPEFAECALALATGIVCSERIVSVESPSMSPAELERRLASPGRKWDRQPRLAF